MRHIAVLFLCLLITPSLLIGVQTSWFGSKTDTPDSGPHAARHDLSIAMAGATGGRTGEYIARGPKSFENEKKAEWCIGLGMFTVASNKMVGYNQGVNVMDQNSWSHLGRFKQDGPAYAVHAVSGSIVFLSTYKTVSAWHLVTKSKLWEFDITATKDRKVITTPVIYNNNLYCLREGNIYAIDTKTGKTHWIYNRKSSKFGVKFAVGNGILCTSSKDHLKAIDLETGKIKWASSIVNSAHTGPIITGGTILIPTRDKEQHPNIKLSAFKTKTGKRIWKSTFELTEAHHNGAVSGNIIVIPGKGKLGAINLLSGKTIWTIPMGTKNDENNRYFCTDPIIADGVAYMGIGKSITAIIIDNGKKLWAHDATVSRQRDSNMVVSDGRLYYMNKQSLLCCISGSTDFPDVDEKSSNKIVDQLTLKEIGEISWYSKEKYFKNCKLSCGNGNIYAANENAEIGNFSKTSDNVYCFDAATGSRKPFKSSTSTRRPVMFASNRLFLTSDKDFYCVDATSGKTLWSHGDTKLKHSLPGLVYNIDHKDFILATVRESSNEKAYSFIRSINRGKKIWQIRHKDLESGISPPQKPALSSDSSMACFKIGSKMLTGFDLQNKKVKWEITFKGKIIRFPMTYKDSFTVVINKGLLQFINVDSHTGEITSTRYLPGSKNPYAVAIIDDLLIYLTKKKEIHAINLNTWKREWRLKLESQPYSPIYLKNDVLLFADNSHKVLAIDHKSGKLLGKTNLPHLWPPSMKVLNDDIFYTDTFGRIVSVKLYSSK